MPFGINSDKITSSRVEALNLHLEYAFDRGVNLRDRIVVISKEIDSDVFDHIDAALTELEALSKQKIFIHLNSFGGSTYDALAIIGRMRKSPCKIVVEVYGMVMSSAMLIFAAGNLRRVSRYAWGMHHSTSYSISGSHNEVTAYVKQAEEENRAWCRWMAEFSHESADYWAETGSTTDQYFSPGELVELGVADEIF